MTDDVTTTLTQAEAREAFRRTNGEFGEQTHDDPGVVDLPDPEEPTPRSNVFTGVSLGAYQRMTERIAKINERAAKRGFTGSYHLDATPRTVTETDESGFTHTYDVLDVTLEGTPPRYEGWTFLATVEPVQLDENTTEFILRTAPWSGDSGIDRSELREGWCDHCKTTRHNRRKIYLVRDDSGQTLQVGSTCIKDFLGWNTLPVMIDSKDIEDELGGLYSSADPVDHDTTYSVAVALAAAKVFGWQPSSGDMPTRTVVLDTLSTVRKVNERFRAQLAPHMDDALAEAPKVIETVLANLDTSTDFGANLSIALRSKYTNHSRMGLVAATVSAYQRITQQQAERAAVAPSTWVGTVGDKISPTVTVIRADTVDGYAYNTTQRMLIMRTPEGDVLKAYSSAGWTYDVSPGDTFEMGAVVKSHDTFRDTQQTVVTRIKRIPNTPTEETA